MFPLWTVLEAAAVGFDVTESGTVGDVGNTPMSSESTHTRKDNSYSSNIDVRSRTGSARF